MSTPAQHRARLGSWVRKGGSIILLDAIADAQPEGWGFDVAPLEVASTGGPFMTEGSSLVAGVLGEAREHEGQTGPEAFPADAFVADKDGKVYLETFPRLGELSVQKAIVLAPATFESLLDHMLASTRNHFVIDAHGDPNGLHMPLAAGTGISATRRSLFMLRGIDQVRTLVRLANENDTFWERASGADLERWRRIVQTMHSKTWQAMIGPTWPSDMPAVPSVGAARSIVQSRLSALAESLFPGSVGDRQARVDRLIKKMRDIQARNIRQIQFRACNIGKDAGSLLEFRNFFGADYLCAPDVRSGMGFVIPQIGRTAVDGLVKRRLTQLYDLPGGRFAIWIEISGTKFRAASAADTQQAVLAWVAVHVMVGSKYRKGVLPIHFLQMQPLAFALDSDYAMHIKCRSSFWEGAVRSHEFEHDEAHEAKSTALVRHEDLYGPVVFEHQVGTGSGAVEPFPGHPYVLGLEMTNQTLLSCAEAVERDPNTTPMCGAVADLTGRPELPPFFAHNPIDMLYVASLAKIYPMYVAFELRKRVEQQAKDMIKLGLSTTTDGWERQVYAALAKSWRAKLRARFPALPPDMPKFQDIFVLSPTGDARFAENDPPLSDADLDFRPPHPKQGHPPISPEFKTPQGKFLDWMRLMLRWSNNEAASRCIRALSYSYINGTLTAAGFFDPKSRAGLWLSGDYLGNDWAKANGAAQPLSPRWARLQRRTVTNFGGNAFQVARLLTLLAQDRLVSKVASREMISIMTGVAGIGSYIRGALVGATPRRAFSAIASKIGCGDEVPPPACGFTHDCAIVRLDRARDPATPIRYVVVALGGDPRQARADLRKMAVRFHDCVVTRHR